jgi:hypothetical protein
MSGPSFWNYVVLSEIKLISREEKQQLLKRMLMRFSDNSGKYVNWITIRWSFFCEQGNK